MIMAQMELHTTCDNCISLVQHAASILQSFDEELPTLYDRQHQSQLIANVASSKCHMCTLLHTQIPRLSEPFESGLELIIWARRVPGDPRAIRIKLVGESDKSRTNYPGSLRVHEGEIGPKPGTMRADLSPSWTWKYPDSQVIPDVVPRIVELHTILAE